MDADDRWRQDSPLTTETWSDKAMMAHVTCKQRIEEEVKNEIHVLAFAFVCPAQPHVARRPHSIVDSISIRNTITINLFS